jgi:glutathione-regulated potassium-efflux system ancillary protein KefG
MKNILILYAHPNYQNSQTNKKLINGLEKIKNITINNLYQKYPNYNINIAVEQELLLQNDLIIFQFPYYWFNTTPLLKLFIDNVFEDGFAYGTNNKLKNKSLMCCITSGGSFERYSNDIGFSFNELLKPFEKTANYCGIKYLPPFIVADVYNLNESQLNRYTESYKNILNKFINDEK